MTAPLPKRSRPATGNRTQHVPIVRCNRAEKFKICFYSLSSDVTGLDVHFAGRSVICPGPTADCKYCERGSAVRWVGYLGATDFSRTKRFLVEVTAGCLGGIDAYLDRWDTLRGAWITLTRPSGRDTGKIAIDLNFTANQVSQNELPADLDCDKILGKIYAFDDPTPEQSATPPGTLDPVCAIVTDPGPAPDLPGQLPLPEIPASTSRISELLPAENTRRNGKPPVQ